MSCQETQVLLDGYVDGELDLVKSLEIEQHLQGCASCTQAAKNHQVLRSAIHASSPYYQSPANLQKRIQVSVRKAGRAQPASRGMLWRGLGIAAALACAVLIVLWSLGPGRMAAVPAGEDLLAREALSSHVRSLMADHLADIASSDQHTVKPWFTGKLDYSPPVQDLAYRGYPLVAGRLDYLDGRPVAALVYRRHKHVINLFVWPALHAGVAEPALVTRRGYHLCHWVRTGMTYWAVSDLNERELEDFVRLLQNSAPLPPGHPSTPR